MTRGDIVLVYVPFVGVPGGKNRPALVVQSNSLFGRIDEMVIAGITSNLAHCHLPHQLLIDLSTPEGATSGLLHDSAIRCEQLFSVLQADVQRRIGHLPDALMLKIDACLKEALGIA